MSSSSRRRRSRRPRAGSCGSTTSRPRARARELAGPERPAAARGDPRARRRGSSARAAAAPHRRDAPRLRLRLGRRRPLERARAGDARPAAARPGRERRAASASTLRERTGSDVAVIVTDSFGRPFRQGTTDVAIGVAGIAPLLDLRGTVDRAGYVAPLDAGRRRRRDRRRRRPRARGEGGRHPGRRSCAASKRAGDGSAAELVIPAERDLFR